MAEEYLTLRQAREYLGVSKPKMRELVKKTSIAVYTDPLDKRKHLVRKDDLDKLRQPQPRLSNK